MQRTAGRPRGNCDPFPALEGLRVQEEDGGREGQGDHEAGCVGGVVLNKLFFFPAETQEAISEEVAGGSGLCAVAIMGTETVTHPPLASLEEGWLHQHMASWGSAGAQGREDSSPVTQQMAGLALQPEAGVPSLDGVKDRSERARKAHDHVLLRPVDTRCPGEGHSSHCSPRTAAEAARTSLALCSKTGSCCKTGPSKRAAQSPWTLDEGWWLEGWACLWVSVVGFVIDWVLLGSGRGPQVRRWAGSS